LGRSRELSRRAGDRVGAAAHLGQRSTHPVHRPIQGTRHVPHFVSLVDLEARREIPRSHALQNLQRLVNRLGNGLADHREHDHQQREPHRRDPGEPDATLVHGLPRAGLGGADVRRGEVRHLRDGLEVFRGERAERSEHELLCARHVPGR
jgi:hypothetical protein